MQRRSWLLICLLLVPMVLVVGIGIGIVFLRVLQTVPAPAGTPASSGAAPGGVRIKELSEGEELFKLVGLQALAYEYSGGDVEFWVEMETDGKKRKVVHTGGLGPCRAPGPKQIVKGRFVWVRTEADDSGKERWRHAFSRCLVSEESSEAEVSSPLVKVKAVQGKEDQWGRILTGSNTVPVWKAEKNTAGSPAASGSVQGWSATTLPTDKEVCLKKITEERKRGEAVIQRHVFRVMCKVVADRKKPEEAESR